MPILIHVNCFQNSSNLISREESFREQGDSVEVEEFQRGKAMNEFQFLFKACIFGIFTIVEGRKVV